MDWDELGDALEDIGAKPDRDVRIGDYRQIAESFATGVEGRAETLTCLGEELMSAGRLDEAEETFEQAIADGGRTVLDPHVGLLAVALDRGDEARVDELLALLLTMSRADRLVVGDYEWIAESLEAAGRLKAALRWFTIPLRDIQPGDLDMMPVIALNGRWRVRRELDLPVDAYDEAHDVWHEVNAAQG